MVADWDTVTESAVTVWLGRILHVWMTFYISHLYCKGSQRRKTLLLAAKSWTNNGSHTKTSDGGSIFSTLLDSSFNILQQGDCLPLLNQLFFHAIQHFHSWFNSFLIYIQFSKFTAYRHSQLWVTVLFYPLLFLWSRYRGRFREITWSFTQKAKPRAHILQHSIFLSISA